MARARVVAFAALCMAWAVRGNAQRVGVYPERITFQLVAYTTISSEQPPFRFVEIAPSPFGVEKVSFQLKAILPENLPSGAPTNFVVVSPSGGISVARTHATSLVALNPKVVPYMLPGGYALNLVFENPEHPEVGTSSVRVVLALNNPGLPEIGSVTSATSMRPGISPGQLVTIRGAHLSSPPVIGEADSAGVFPKAISNTRVRFNGIAAPLLYVSNDQINCVVPYGVAGSTEAQVVVDRMFPSGLNETSKAVTVAVRDTSPGIFTVDASGGGPGAIVNSGARTGLNSQENPAPGGSGITFYATGAGIWNVAYPDGSLVLDARLGLAPPSPEFLAPVAPVSVMVGGQPAKVVMAIAQRMRVSGMLEVTVEIPAGLEPGAQPLVLKIGENDNADQNVTVWVQ